MGLNLLLVSSFLFTASVHAASMDSILWTSSDVQAVQSTCEQLGFKKNREEEMAKQVSIADQRFRNALSKEGQNMAYPDATENLRDLHLLDGNTGNAEWFYPASVQANASNPDFLSKLTAWNKMLDYDVQYERNLYQTLDETLSADKIEARVKDLAAAMSAEIQKEPKLTQALKLKLMERLKHVKVITARSIRAMPADYAQYIARQTFVAWCGDDLSTAQAVASGLPMVADVDFSKGTPVAKSGAVMPAVMLVCPGLAIISSGMKDKLAQFDSAILHELGHVLSWTDFNLDTDSNGEQARPNHLDSELLQQQESWISCMSKNYSDGMKTYQTLIEEIRARLGDDPLRALQMLGVVKGLLLSENSYLNYLKRPPSAMDSHLSELEADYWADRVLARRIAAKKNMTPLEAIASSFPLFCEAVMRESPVFPNGDDGSHPPHVFRIEMFLRNPVLKKALETSAVLKRPEGPWCAF